MKNQSSNENGDINDPKAGPKKAIKRSIIFRCKKNARDSHAHPPSSRTTGIPPFETHTKTQIKPLFIAISVFDVFTFTVSLAVVFS